MATLCMADLPFGNRSNVVAFDPVQMIDNAMCEFCSRHGIPGTVTAEAINCAHAHHERGASPAAAIENGKTHVRLWLRMHRSTGPEAA